MKNLRGRPAISQASQPSSTLLFYSAIALTLTLSTFRVELVTFLRSAFEPHFSASRDLWSPDRGNLVELPSLDTSQAFSLRLHFFFKPSASEGYPNLFQTADTNNGVRVEMHGNTIGLVVQKPDGSLEGPILSNSVAFDRWHELTIKADIQSPADGVSTIYANLDHIAILYKVFTTATAAHPRIGGGFSNDRVFSGQMRDLKVELIPYRRAGTSQLMFSSLHFCLFAVLVVYSLRLYFKNRPTATAWAKTSRREQPIDLLLSIRAFACIIVLVGHGFLIAFAPKDLRGLLAEHPYYRSLIPIPWVGVWIFFTLSGYLMGHGFFVGRYDVSREGITHFYGNRFLRVVPIYAAVFLFTALIAYRELFTGRNLYEVFDVLGFDYNGADGVNAVGAMWSLSTEMQFYLLTPFLCPPVMRVARRSASAWCVVLLCAAAIGFCFRYFILYTFRLPTWYTTIYTSLLGNIDLFLIGALANPFIASMKPRFVIRSYAVIPLFVFIISSIYFVSCYFSPLVMIDGKFGPFLSFAPAFFAIATVLLIFVGDGFLESKVITRTTYICSFAWLGTTSYAVYLIHEPLFRFVSLNFSRFSRYSDIGTVPFLVAVFIILLVAFVTYICIEKPIDQLKG